MVPRLQAPGYVRWVTRTLEKAGFETWAVGGAIRNTLLGLPAGDWDMATRAPPGMVQKLFPRTVPVGVDHGTVGILTREGVLLEVTTFRKDVETSGRHAVVAFAETIHEDLARRDFTINAVAWHPLRREFRDPFGGRADLQAGILKTVGKPSVRFAEDYLRVLRALRFSGRFRLRIEAETWRALGDATEKLPLLSAERIREELTKVLVQDPRPSGALSLYAAAGVLDVLFPELSAIVDQNRPNRTESLWSHSILLTDLIPATRPLLRLAALLHCIGYPAAEDREEGLEESRARDRGAAFMIRLRFPNVQIREVTEMVGMGLDPPLALKEPGDLRRWLHRAGPDRSRSFARIWLAKARLDQARWGADPAPVLDLLRRLRKELSRRPPLRLEALAVSGRDLIGLGLRPGPHFGEILEDLMERVLEDPDLNEKGRLLQFVKERFPAHGQEDS